MRTLSLVKSAQAANMNVLRIWGGGIFLPQVFYDTADELGVMLYHDMAVRTTTGVPIDPDQVRHQIRRLSHHPSIVIWDGCNECNALNTSTIITVELPIVASEDNTRAIWPASPSHGWISGVNRLTGRPNGKTLIPVWPVDGPIEHHGPYLHGSGWPAVNGGNTLQTFHSGLPVRLQVTPVGLTIFGQLTSEFGSSVYSSFESMAPTIAANHWSVVISYREHTKRADDSCELMQIILFQLPHRHTLTVLCFCLLLSMLLGQFMAVRRRITVPVALPSALAAM